MDIAPLFRLAEGYKADPESVRNTWFGRAGNLRFSDMEKHREAFSLFGDDYSVLLRVACGGLCSENNGMNFLA